MLLRVQHLDGRGPFRPGITSQWAANKLTYPPALQEDFPPNIFEDVIHPAHARGLHLGCAVEGIEGIERWFTAPERLSLFTLGYRIHDATGCEILAKTEWQVLIGSKRPLSELPIAKPAQAA